MWPIIFAVVALAFGPAVDCDYLITTPRRWTVGAQSQICVVLTSGTFTPESSLSYTLTELKHRGILADSVKLDLPQGESESCIDVSVPQSDDRTVTLDLSGSLGTETIGQGFNLTFVQETERTFIQTDKYKYRPGQKVQFRILSVSGPNLDVVTDNYEEVYITDPSRTRIAQWLDVDNTGGLVHLSFDLYDEIKEGTYTVYAKFPDKSAESRSFSVEEYVLPRYEVTIEAPTNILGSDESVTLNLCAKYTFGEPVNGVANISLAAGRWKTYANLTQDSKISGCQNFTFPSKDLLFDHNNCHIRIDRLVASAVMEEDGTGVQLFGENNNIVVHRKALKFNDKSPSWTEKPYLPVPVKIEVTHVDNKPATNEPMKVCSFYEEEEICKNFTTCAKGYLSFLVPSSSNSRIDIKAVNYPGIERNWNDVMEESEYKKYRYHSNDYIDPTNSSLTIYHSDKLDCKSGENITVDIPVIFVVKDLPSAQVHCQVISRGQVVSLENMQVDFAETDLPFQDDEHFLPLEKVPPGVTRGSFNYTLNLPPSTSPKIKLLVWYSTPDGVVVADSKEISITDCLPHNVEMSWSAEKVEPGKEANLILKGASDALCSIGVVDKSVELLSSANNHLDIRTILQVAYNSEVAQWDNDQLNLQYCRSKYGDVTGTATGTGTSDGTDGEPLSSFRVPFDRYSDLEAIHMFKEAGYFVHSSLTLEKRFCDDLIIQDEKRKASRVTIAPIPMDADVVADRISDRNKVIGGGVQFAAAPPHPAEKTTTVNEDAPLSLSVVGGAEEPPRERSYLPETWLWLIKPLSATGELSESVKLPDSITEWVGRTVCVHPTAGVGTSSASSIITFTPFFVDLTLPATAIRGEILPVKISVFNYLDDDLPVKLVVEASEEYDFVEGSGARDICVLSKNKHVETVKMNMTKIGDINITVEAASDVNSAASCGTGTPPIKKDRFIRSLPVEPEGYPREQTWTKYICGQDVENTGAPVDTWNMAAPEGIVEDSERSWITVIGDLVGPTVENLGNLVELPTGCGEQNLVNFAPSIYVRQYLDAANRTTDVIKAKIEKFLINGYQRQLSFRHNDGSFSSFGERDKEGSTWLTAFVVKSFAHAKPYTLIDDGLLKQSTDWLLSQQNKDTGCFLSRGRVLTKSLLGGIQGSGGSPPLLTAYVLAAILEAGKVESPVITNAVKCIETDTSDHPYSMALKAYSLALAEANQPPTEPSKATAMIDKLLEVAATNASVLRWSLPDRRGENTALHVETAAYALLALVTHNPQLYSEQTRKIVRWLTGMRNGRGGFISTQDTVVGLQALAAFQKEQPKEGLDMLLGFSSPSHSFSVKEENRLLQQRIDVPATPNVAELTVSGTGCSLAQGVLRYNVLGDSNSDAFILKVDTKPAPEKDCNTHTISVCTSYTFSDHASNMAIVEVKLISGYIPIKQDLKKLIKDVENPLKRYEVDGPKVIFYFDEIASKELCFDFRVYQEYEIEGAKPGSVKVYDYYQPEYITTQKFTFTSQDCAPPS